MNRVSFRTKFRIRVALISGAAAVALAVIAGAFGAPAIASAQGSQPVLLASGQFGAVDGLHKGQGSARLFRLSDGQRILRLEEFKVTNGPDLYVYLSGHAAPRNSGQLHDGGALEVGRLKGNIGNQNYALPADVDLSKFKSVVIYCKQFSVVFSTAELSRS